MKPTCVIMVFAAAIGVIGGCNDARDLCTPFLGRYEVRYVGGAIGRGEMQIDASQPGDYAASVSLALRNGGENGDSIFLAGPATCESSIVRAQFVGGEDQIGEVRVLGGTLEAVMAPQMISDAFGAWDVRYEAIADAENVREAQGFVRFTPLAESSE